MDTKYNGWTNYETWLVKLWMDNDSSGYDYWTERAQEAYDTASAEKSFTREERATLDLSEQIKSEHEEATPEVTGIWADLINSSLSSVNWYEIAESMIGEVEKEKEEASA